MHAHSGFHILRFEKKHACAASGSGSGCVHLAVAAAFPQAVRLSYLDYLKTFLTLPLRERGSDGAQECVDMLEEYGLSRDDLFEVSGRMNLLLPLKARSQSADVQ